MGEVLLALQLMLKAALVDVVPQVVRIVQIRPEAWIRENLNTRMDPALFIYQDAYNIRPGRVEGTADETFRIALTIYHQSVDPLGVEFNPISGVHGSSDKLTAALFANPKIQSDLNDPKTQVVNRMNLPMDTQFFQSTQIAENSSLWAVGHVRIVEYERLGRPWSGPANRT